MESHTKAKRSTSIGKISAFLGFSVLRAGVMRGKAVRKLFPRRECRLGDSRGLETREVAGKMALAQRSRIKLAGLVKSDGLR
jgi:hypothetical protein